MNNKIRILSLILAVIMIVGIVPLSVFATGRSASEKTVLIACSDFQESTDELGAENVRAILSRIKPDYPTADALLFCGDLDDQSPSVNVQQSWNALYSATEEFYPDGLDSFIVQGNHDGQSNPLMAAGAYEKDNYSVFIINYEDFHSTYDATVLGELDSFLKSKAAADYDRPIFILSHKPLHYTSRNDVPHAKKFFDVINSAAADGLNIVFLFGHNHSSGYDSYLGGGSIYLPAGSEMFVQDASGSYTTETLNFTYMNAGYVGYISSSNSDRVLTMAVFTIDGSGLKIERYSAQGTHNLKSAGTIASSYNFTGCVANTDVVPSGEIIELSESPTLIHEPTGLKVKTANGTALSVENRTVSGELLAEADCNGNYKCYDIEISGYSVGEKATVYFPLNSLNTPVRVYRVGDDGLERIAATIEGDYAVFSTTHFSAYMVSEVDLNDLSNLDWVKVPNNEYYAFERDGYHFGPNYSNNNFAGNKYMILGTENVAMIPEPDGTVAATEVTVSSDNHQTSCTNGDYLWTLIDASGNANDSDYSNFIYSEKYRQYLSVQNGVITMSDDPFAWVAGYDYTSDSGKYYLTLTPANDTSSYVRVSSSTGTARLVTDAHNVRFYGIVTSEIEDKGYAAVASQAVNIYAGDYSSSSAVLDRVKNTIEVYRSPSSNGFGATPVSDYILSGTVNPDRAGSYKIGVKVEGASVGTVTVNVVERTVTGVSMVPESEANSVPQYSPMTAATGSKLTVAYNDGSYDVIDVTVGMIDGGAFNINTPGSYMGLTINYEGFAVSGYSLNVTPVSTEWVEVPGSSTYTYTLDTDGVNYGEKYLIVAQNDAYALHGSDRVAITVNGETATTNTDAYEWLIASEGGETTTKYNTTTLYHKGQTQEHTATDLYRGEGTDPVRSITSTKDRGKVTWTVVSESGTYYPSGDTIDLYRKETTTSPRTTTISQNGVYLISGTANQQNISVGSSAVDWDVSLITGGNYDITSNGFCVRYSPSNNVFQYRSDNVDNHYVRLYRRTGDPVVTEGHYAMLEGDRVYSFATGSFSSVAALEAELRSHLTVWTADSADGAGKVRTTDYALEGNINPSTAGTYTLKVMHEGTELGKLSVTFADLQVRSIELLSDEGTVQRGASHAKTGSKLRVTYDDGSTAEIDVTVPMLKGSFTTSDVGVYENLTVTYGGKGIGGYTLKVVPKPGEQDYPDYPSGGSVRVGKTGEGIDFQSTGVAKIELTASGIPLNNGIDVIVMLDTSSSMDDEKISALQNSVTDMIDIFQTPNEDGSEPDIRIAVADFNGYTPISKSDILSSNYGTNAVQAKVFTGDGSIGLGGFASINSIDNVNGNFAKQIVSQSGTNYDYGFDTIYRLGAAIKADNEAREEYRDLYVIFMSDGAAHQFNYYYSSGSVEQWNNWLLGTFSPQELPSDYQYYFNSPHPHFYNNQGNNWMAEAIKGLESDVYPVIDPTESLGEDASDVYGEYFRYVPGLGATMYTVGFGLGAENSITRDTVVSVVRNLASVDSAGNKLFYNAMSGDNLDDAFAEIATEIRPAARNSHFDDTMGKDYDLQLAQVSYKAADGTTKTITPVIEFNKYMIYKSADVGTTVNGHLVTVDDVGKRYGEPELAERVTFSDDGTRAYSTVLGSGVDIFQDGIIKANYFYYNTTSETVYLDMNGDGAEEALAPETFFWNTGTSRGVQIALSYYVYLTGSMEGTRPAGSYPTNESAVLYYINWLGHDAKRETVSPVMPWKGANVSYAFYLVDDNGEPVVNRATGQTGNFTNRVAVTREVVYKEILLNSIGDVDPMEIVATGVLPEGYELFDEGATYTVRVSSDGLNSSWNVTSSKTVATTYVANYGGDPTKQMHAEGSGYDYTHTVVWFAVKYSIKALPDIVVIDYGIPVDINVIDNDLFGGYGRLSLVGTGVQPNDKSQPEGFAASITTAHGIASVKDENTIRYTPNSMTMNSIDSFLYAVYYEKTDSDSTENNGYYYSYVKVVPATSIYYEDKNNGAGFVIFGDGEAAWIDEGSEKDGVQAQDRPGASSIANDANNNYGYDPAYADSITYSLGRAKKVNVKTGMKNWPTAQFTFTGTGFDILSVTSNATGFIRVQVYDKDGVQIKSWAVDTYYGYTSVAGTEKYYKLEWLFSNGSWHAERTLLTDEAEIDEAKNNLNIKLPPSPKEGDTFTTYEYDYDWASAIADTGALYQVPVIKSYDTLSYGTYTVKITPMYSKLFDHVGDQNYDFYFDAVRIYNPAGKCEDTSDEILSIYKQDNEAYPQYIEMREQLIAADSFGTITDDDAVTSGAVFIDSFGINGDISEYTTYGPNNEIYLNPGQSVAFGICGNGTSVASNIASVQIGAKCVNDATSFSVNGRTFKLATSTDTYHKVTDLISWKEDGSSNTIIITNNGSSIVSLTTMKVTYKNEPIDPATEAPAKAAMFMSRSMATAAVQTVYTDYVASVTEQVKPVKPAEPDSGNTEEGGDVTLPDAFIPYVRRDTGSTEKPPISDRPGTFVPNKFKVTLAKNKATAGQTVRMTIVTSSEVAAVWINGEKATLYSTDSSTGEKTFRYVVTCTSMGEKTVSAVAYNADGVSSRSIESMIKVTANKK